MPTSPPSSPKCPNVTVKKKTITCPIKKKKTRCKTLDEKQLPTPESALTISDRASQKQQLSDIFTEPLNSDMDI